MKKKILLFSSIFTVCISTYLYFNSPNVHQTIKKADTDLYQTVERNKEWVIVFDEGINESLLNSDNTYVLDERNNYIPVKIQRENNVTIKILPPKEGYKTGSNYYLFINKELDLKDLGKDTQQKEYKIAFKVDKNV
ncbi:hypothetical protein [Thermaerobacillus caldiproteolyticus]|uniref:SbsA Ig-like domain-containing protein n=1 Tax=Thermaerobacillus caldiproteolyticus TaxID=247480 RepID=A0A7V9Z5X0_9BACL|nr:hypothetical protein [Anoxybacillus caldiproteolyticus]MBA2874653.1 hypothetical protein [Anoxybacillus caldiproteolyticus]